MTLVIIVGPTVKEGQPSWPTAAVVARVNRNVMQAFRPSCPPARPPGGGEVDAGSGLTTILPAMTLAEAIETMRIHRVAGRTGDCTAFMSV